MNYTPFYAVVCTTCLLALGGSAATHYVRAGWTNAVSPYTSWATAASILQDAVAVANTGALIVVTNGVYATGGAAAAGSTQSNRLMATVPMRITSIHGPASTIIVGNGPVGADDAVRCANLGAGVFLDGFTLSNGAAASSASDGGGGGALLAPDAVLSNCVVVACSAARGGGVFADGGGIVRSAIIGNFTWHGEGGGIYALDRTRIEACVISDNISINHGGGMWCSNDVLVRNCVVARNRAFVAGAGVWLQAGSTLESSTVVSNSNNEGLWAGAATTVRNSIVYYNGGNNAWLDYAAMVAHCCLPAPVPGPGNITAPPCLRALGHSDFSLTGPSPCINQGSNTAWMLATGATDLACTQRVLYGTVDIGAYEYVASNAVPRITPTYLNFDSVQVARTVMLGNDGERPFDYRCAVAHGSNWLCVTPAVGVVSNSTHAAVVSVDRSHCGTGDYTGAVLITPAVGDAVTITCVMRVAVGLLRADAGGPYETAQGTPVLLNGNVPVGTAGTYAWLIDGLPVAMANPAHAFAEFTPYRPGTATVTFVAYDSIDPAHAATSTTTLIVHNVAPLLDGGGPYGARTNVAVALIAHVHDPGTGDKVIARWTYGDGSTSDWLTVRGSGAAMRHLTNLHYYTCQGTYMAACCVLDEYGGAAQAVASVLVNGANVPPVAVASVRATGVAVTETNMDSMATCITLHGGQSFDDWLDGAALIYDWREDVYNPAKPLFSDAQRRQAALTIPSFPLPGRYLFHLVVNDGEYNSQPASVVVHVPGIAGVVKSELASLLPLYQVGLSVTNVAVGRAALHSVSDFEGAFTLDTGVGVGIPVMLERNGVAKAITVNSAADGKNNYVVTFPSPLCGFSAVVSTMTNGGTYVVLPYAQTEIIIGSEAAFAGSVDYEGAIAFADIPELWPWTANVNYQVLYQKAGYEADVVPLQVEQRVVARHYPVLNAAQATAITGQVVGAHNLPVTGVRVDFGPLYAEVITDTGGYFIVNPVMPGEYFVRLAAPGFQTTYRTAFVINQSLQPAALQIRGGALSIYGEVFDAAAPWHPLTNVVVRVLNPGTPALASVTNSLTGYYDLSAVRGARIVAYEAAGYLPHYEELALANHVRRDIFLEAPEPALHLLVYAFFATRRRARWRPTRARQGHA